MLFVQPLAIQQQINGNACISASASSLIDAFGLPPLSQAALHPLVAAGMNPGMMNGFDSLNAALQALQSPIGATRHAPSAVNLAAWFQGQAPTHQGFLIAHHVMVRGQKLAHITVVFHDLNGAWFRADPGPATTTAISLSHLATSYAGDVAILA